MLLLYNSCFSKIVGYVEDEYKDGHDEYEDEDKYLSLMLVHEDWYNYLPLMSIKKCLYK